MRASGSSRLCRDARQAARAAVQLSFSVAPSNNVNGGSSDRYNVIDGVPLVGVLSGSALALPGTVARGSARLRYRLAGDNRTQTDLTGALQLTRVHLSDEAHAKAPGVDDADFGSTYAELGLRHARLAGPRGGLVETEAELGRVWSGGTRSHDVARASLSYSLSAGKTARMTYSGTIQRQFGFADGRDDVDTGALAVSWQTALANLLFNLGTIYNALGQFDEAALAFDKAREIGLPWRMLWYQFGPYEAYYETGRYEDVIVLADVTMGDRPYFEESFYFKGLAQIALGQVEEGRQNLERYVAFNPNFQPAVQALADLDANDN